MTIALTGVMLLTISLPEEYLPWHASIAFKCSSLECDAMNDATIDG